MSCLCKHKPTRVHSQYYSHKGLKKDEIIHGNPMQSPTLIVGQPKEPRIELCRTPIVWSLTVVYGQKINKLK